MKKRYTFSLLFLVLLVSMCYSRQLSENEARDIAVRFAKKSSNISLPTSSLKLAYVGKKILNKEEGLLYVYNKGVKEGFIVVAGDDRVNSKVLGYTDKGAFEYSQIPENLKYWLGEYERQIEYMQKNGIESESEEKAKFSTSVAPLLGDIKWGQSSPYNLMCPTLANGGNAVSGCVATAMAQIMYYWQWPDVGTGSHSYTWKYNGMETILSEDFSKSKYEWNLMSPVYDESSSTESQLAVAKLMSDVGISVDMNYNTSSGAYSNSVPKAMKTYFKYDESIRFLSRSRYYSAEWEQMMRDELNDGRVLYYAGGTYDDSRHAFLCDGYNEDGYFHFNWGWNGSYNGYFLTTAMDPTNQSIVGSDSGYDFSQEMVVGIQPEKEGSEDRTEGYVKLDSWEIITSECALGGRARIDIWGVWNCYEDTLGFNFALNLYKGNEFVKTSMIVTREVTPPGMGRGGQYHSFYFPFELEDGNYRIYPQYKFIEEPDSSYRNMTTSNVTPDYINVDIKDGKVKLSFPDLGYKLKTKTFKTDNYIVARKKSRVNITLLNEGVTEYYGGIFLKVQNSSNSIVASTVRAVSIEAGEEISFVCEIPAIINKGFYTVTLCDELDNVVFSKGIYVSEEEGTPKLSITENLTPISYEMLPSDIRATAKLKNTGGYFNGDIELMIYADNNIYRRFYCYVTLINGEEKTLSFSGKFIDGVIGKEYKMALRRYDVTNKSQVWGNQVVFTLKNETSSVSDVKKENCVVYPNPAETVVAISSDVAVNRVEVYSLSGTEVLRQDYQNSDNVELEVSSLTAGLYMLRVLRDDGTIKVLKLKKK